MALCPDCNKFVPYGEPEIEIEDTRIEGTTLYQDFRVQLTCEECGCVLKEASMTGEAELDHHCPEGAEIDPLYDGLGEDSYEIEDEGNPDGTDRRETHDRKGKPIKFRYQRQFYGASNDVEVKCLRCNTSFHVNVSAEEQASAFEECC